MYSRIFKLLPGIIICLAIFHSAIALAWVGVRGNVIYANCQYTPRDMISLYSGDKKTIIASDLVSGSLPHTYNLMCNKDGGWYWIKFRSSGRGKAIWTHVYLDNNTFATKNIHVTPRNKTRKK
ncbi:MAG: hypothetical protein GF315_07205 [candidate division Zixibacteria bacterium]|nr:hypothetical protein [candidate division Zixibacteria bacterium]